MPYWYWDLSNDMRSEIRLIVKIEKNRFENSYGLPYHDKKSQAILYREKEVQ